MYVCLPMNIIQQEKQAEQREIDSTGIAVKKQIEGQCCNNVTQGEEKEA